MEGEPLRTTDLGTSIAQTLELLLHTHYGEQRSDSAFGCAIWELDFDKETTNRDWELALIRSMTAAIGRYETRLEKPKVTARVAQIERTFSANSLTELRKKADIFIGATIRETQQPFRFHTHLYLGPISGS